MAENTLSQNITQAISDFDSIKTAIEDKGVTVSSGTPTSDYADLIGDISSGDDSVLKGLIQRTATSLNIPQGTTSIGNRAFNNYNALSSITIPNSVTSIGDYAFDNCQNLLSITIPSSVTSIGEGAFSTCLGITGVIIPNSVTQMGRTVFYYCRNLTSVTIPNSLVNVGGSMFMGCPDLTNVTIENGFNCNNLNLSGSTSYSSSTIVSWLNALYDRTGQGAYTLTIGATNLAKLTAEEIAIATNKNWNLA